jgi:AhpD family alkylhydroperoxidase
MLLDDLRHCPLKVETRPAGKSSADQARPINWRIDDSVPGRIARNRFIIRASKAEEELPTMHQRLRYGKAFPEGVHALKELGRVISSSPLEPTLVELVKTRASQLNGCAYCIDMHTQDARAAGETEQRLYALSAWEETPFFSPRERAALAWTEAVTNIQRGHAPDAVYEEVRKEFSETELVALTFAIGQINFWNRISIAFRVEPGTYQPQTKARS